MSMSDTPITDAFEADEEDGLKRGWKRWPIFARELEREVWHWKRMYECAQNANAHRQAALGE